MDKGIKDTGFSKLLFYSFYQERREKAIINMGKELYNDLDLARLNLDSALSLFEHEEGIITDAQKEAFKAGFWACFQAMK